MARMADMEADNANIMEQHREWQAQRRQGGEDANDWSAFREHLMAIGAPDPGEEQPEGFWSDEESEDLQTASETQSL